MSRKRYNSGFWERMTMTDSGCWEWQGYRNAQGYGCYYPTGKKFLSHRHAYALTHGPVPHGLLVLHKCDNPPCCNPDHLFLGTHADNSADMCAKGRHRTTPLRGTSHPEAKFTADEIRSIRNRVAAGESRTTLARELGVSISTISLITLRKHYTEVL